MIKKLSSRFNLTQGAPINIGIFFEFQLWSETI